MITDEIIDSLQFYWNHSPTRGPWTRNGPRLKKCPPQLHLLEDALTLQYWEIHLETWSAMILKELFMKTPQKIPAKQGFHQKIAKLFYKNKDTNEITISDNFSEVRMSSKAFERLMHRYFEVIITGIPKHKKEWLSSHQKLWQQLVQVARLLQEKISYEKSPA